MRHLATWCNDARLRRLFRNASTLFAGSSIASLLGMLSMVITARALGATAFGVLALVSTLALVVERLATFQSWQAVIRYGVEAQQRGSEEDIASLVKLGIILDVTAGIIGGFVFLAIAHYMPSIAGWEERYVGISLVFSLTVFFAWTGTATGVLRLFDRFKVVAFHRTIMALIKLAAVGFCYSIGAGIAEFVLVWVSADILYKLTLFALGLAELRRQQIFGFMGRPVRYLFTVWPDLTRFVLTTNLHSSVRAASREIDTLVVGAILTAQAAGLYKIARQIALALNQLSDPFYQAIYPDLSRLWVDGNFHQFNVLLMRCITIAALIGVVIWVFTLVLGDEVIIYLLGPEFRESYIVLLWYMAGAVIGFSTFPMQPAMLSMGLAQASLIIVSVSSVVYLLVLPALLIMFGVKGAGMAHVAFYIMWCALVARLFIRHNRA